MGRAKEEDRRKIVIFHKSVLLHKTLDFLNPKSGDLFIDATAGGGGHTFELLRRGARVLAIDRDQEAIEQIRSKREIDGHLTLVKGNFANIGQIARANGFEKVNGILFDLGVSSYQLDTPERGFSFQKEGPLDMRMDPDLNLRAGEIVNRFERRRLYEIFKTFGQEKFSRAISKAICSARQIKPIETTAELAQIIKYAVPRGVGKNKRKVHPATKAFQALRIVVNSELLNLEEALVQTQELLKIDGRLVIISFHSLEDEIVKRFFKQNKNFNILTKKPIGPEEIEINQNPRARSAKLRAAVRI